MFGEINWGGMIFQFLVLGLILLFVISFSLFIRRLLLSSSEKNSQLDELHKKLDKIIELLEKDKNDSK